MGQIDVSIIAPARYLREFAAQVPARVHHVAAQRVLQDEQYRQFFREQAEDGASIVVDNGVFDLGDSLAAEDLISAARAVAADEIILPDVMRDGAATVRASDAAAVEFSKYSDGLRFCVVVHGADHDDWRHCLEAFTEREYVGAMALPASRKPVTGAVGPANDRILAAQYLADNGHLSTDRIYRMLGLGRLGHLELAVQRHHDWIASVDCATPVILGSMGVRMLPGGPYEKVPTPRVETIDYIDPQRFGLIQENIATVRAAAGVASPAVSA